MFGGHIICGMPLYPPEGRTAGLKFGEIIMPTSGITKWFDPKKGFGFIIGPDGQDVFVHFTQIVGDGFRELKDGESVSYELVQSEKGWQARSVRRLNPPTPKTTEALAGDRPIPQASSGPSRGYRRSSRGNH